MQLHRCPEGDACIRGTMYSQRHCIILRCSQESWRGYAQGPKTRLYREDAYHTGLLIAKECQNVFNEIESILKKTATHSGSQSSDGIFLDRLGKFM